MYVSGKLHGTYAKVGLYVLCPPCVSTEGYPQTSNHNQKYPTVLGVNFWGKSQDCILIFLNNYIFFLKQLFS